MKAKNLKQHIVTIEPREEFDRWDDSLWVVMDKRFCDKQAALRYAAELMEEEFRERYLQEKK